MGGELWVVATESHKGETKAKNVSKLQIGIVKSFVKKGEGYLKSGLL